MVPPALRLRHSENFLALNPTGTRDKNDENRSVSNRNRISLISAVTSCYQNRTRYDDTHVAAARISSIVLDFVNPESMRRKRIVDSMTITIRIEVVLMILQMTTGISRITVTKNKSNTLAIRLISCPEYIYTFASVETS